LIWSNYLILSKYSISSKYFILLKYSKCSNIQQQFKSLKQMRNSDSPSTKMPLPHCPSVVHSRVRSRVRSPSGTSSATRSLTSPSTIATDSGLFETKEWIGNSNIHEFREKNAKITLVQVDYPVPARQKPNFASRSGANGTETGAVALEEWAGWPRITSQNWPKKTNGSAIYCFFFLANLVSSCCIDR